ncbi:hypothetical protein [Haloferula sp.]|uniref:hypothetical protein n=1 Tax=Haloferula sp. TaxID=2497595 RepID=UPI003C73BCF2
MKVISCLLMIAAFVSANVAAIEIRDKQGRAFDAEIISANEKALTVRRSVDNRTFSISREDLDDKTNKLVDVFLEAERKDKDSGVPKVFEEAQLIEVTRDTSIRVGGQTRVAISLKGVTCYCTLPGAGKIEAESTDALGIAGGFRLVGAGGALKVFPTRYKLEDCLERAERERTRKIDDAKTAVGAGWIRSTDLAKVEKLLELRKVNWGQWEGYAPQERMRADLRGETGKYIGSYFVYLTNGKEGFSITAAYPSTLIEPGELEAFVKSLSTNR